MNYSSKNGVRHGYVLWCTNPQGKREHRTVRATGRDLWVMIHEMHAYGYSAIRHQKLD